MAASLTYSAAGRTQTAFSGLLFHIAVPVPAPGRIVIIREQGVVGNALRQVFDRARLKDMPRAMMPHEAFEAEFAVHAENPAAATEFMPEPFLDILLEIGREEGGEKGAKSMTAGFEGRSFYLALERQEAFLEEPSLDGAPGWIETYIHRVFAGFETIFRIIDRLHGVAAAPPNEPPRV